MHVKWLANHVKTNRTITNTCMPRMCVVVATIVSCNSAPLHLRLLSYIFGVYVSIYLLFFFFFCFCQLVLLLCYSALMSDVCSISIYSWTTVRREKCHCNMTSLEYNIYSYIFQLFMCQSSEKWQQSELVITNIHTCSVYRLKVLFVFTVRNWIKWNYLKVLISFKLWFWYRYVRKFQKVINGTFQQ